MEGYRVGGIDQRAVWALIRLARGQEFSVREGRVDEGPAAAGAGKEGASEQPFALQIVVKGQVAAPFNRILSENCFLVCGPVHLHQLQRTAFHRHLFYKIHS